MTPEMQSQIAVWRQKALEGSLTIEEQKDIVKLIRGDRKAAATSAAESRKKVKTAIKSADEMLGELGL